MTGTLLVVLSDTHIGSSTAVSPLSFMVHNRSSYEAQVMEANRLQRWLYGCWSDFYEYVKEKRKKKRVIVVHLGDVIDFNHHGSTQLVQEVGDQAQMAITLLEPYRDLADKFIGILGTAAHAGQDHATEVELYRQLGADYIEQQMTVDIDGVTVDLAHHGRIGTRPWTSGAASLASEIMLDYAQSGIPLPNYIFRGHYHQIDDSGGKFVNTRLIQCPSWQLKTTFSNRVAGNTRRSDIGAILLNNGDLDLSRSRYLGQPDGRKVITL
jgi:uncharacterized protein YkvS